MKKNVVTFKVDQALAQAMQGVQNKSAFIRAAIASALDSTCPLCKGSGILSPDQQKHWKIFASRHTIEKCIDCKATHLVCNNTAKESKAC